MSEEPENGDIFQMLSHTYRKEILRLVSQKPRMYTELMEALGIESGKLRFHLEKVRPLLSQDEHKKYYLSEEGKKALVFLESAEKLELPKREPQSLSNPWLPVIFFLIGLVAGGMAVFTLIPEETPDNSVVEPLEKNLSREEGHAFIPGFEVGVYGMPEVLASNDSKKVRIEIRNVGDVTIRNLTFLIKTEPRDGFYVDGFSGKGMKFEKREGGTQVNIGDLYTNPEVTKSFEFTIESIDSKIDHNIEITAYFQPRDEWVTVYEKEIYVGHPRIIVR